ncbi:hypothetical protein [Bradyrhizobium sp. SZCCHNR1093]|uniref:hypothetical protein n=1 Tax=Bradyrhizobium sp. SZCCHNR1093 TaxID=3057368 RepID=UPI0028E30105|nr:hypothetical protein [Bradyrhizobium sp. SZCCHNR1093]
MPDTIQFLDKLTPQHLAGICLLTGLFVLASFTNAERSTKIAGSVFILALTFAANHPGTYALGMMIVATLVTELSFIERIFAIFLRNDSYFRWNTAPASVQQVAQKKESEAVEPPPKDGDIPDHPLPDSASPTKIPRGASLVLEEETFELIVGQAIAGGVPPFELTGFTYRNIALTNAKLGETFVVDILYKYKNVHAIIEVSASKSFLTRSSLVALRKITNSYKSYLEERHEHNVLVVSILVTRSSVRPSVFSDVYVLAFDGAKFSDNGNALKPLSEIFSRAA